MTIDVIDERARRAILRLTLAERECLKRCLDHQTAKQMAIDLGISVHAVEKRLKMARAKLGLSSSLEAAKLVEALERSGRLGPDPSDLSPDHIENDEGGSVAAPRNETAWITQRQLLYVVSGAILMIILIAAALMMGVQSPAVIESRAISSARVPSAQSAASNSVPTAGTELARLQQAFSAFCGSRSPGFAYDPSDVQIYGRA
jgi:DNA-binding CsgD family transcriptional regulator